MTETSGTKENPITITKDNVAEIIAKAGKILDEAPVPTEGRMFYDPETDEVMKMPEKNKYPVTRPDERK